MKKEETMMEMPLFFALLASSGELAMAGLPDSLPPVRYFLQEINTPVWHWVIRAVFFLGFAAVLRIYFKYAHKGKKSRKEG